MSTERPGRAGFATVRDVRPAPDVVHGVRSGAGALHGPGRVARTGRLSHAPAPIPEVRRETALPDGRGRACTLLWRPTARSGVRQVAEFDPNPLSSASTTRSANARVSSPPNMSRK